MSVLLALFKLGIIRDNPPVSHFWHRNALAFNFQGHWNFTLSMHCWEHRWSEKWKSSTMILMMILRINLKECMITSEEKFHFDLGNYTLRSCKLWIKIKNLKRTLKSFFITGELGVFLTTTKYHFVTQPNVCIKKYSLGRKSSERQCLCLRK